MLSLDRQNELREQYRAQHPNWMPATERFAAEVRACCTAESRILDLGCGRGGLVEQLGHPLAQMVGIDPDIHSLHEHRLRLPRAAGVSVALPFAAQTFDIVYCSWVMEHMATPAEDLAEIYRVLKPAGTLIFITPNRQHPLIRFNQLIGRMSKLQQTLVDKLYGRPPEDTFPVHYRANSPAQLTNLAKNSGFVIDKLQIIPDPTYLAFTPILFRIATTLDAWVKPHNQLHLVATWTRA